MKTLLSLIAVALLVIPAQAAQDNEVASVAEDVVGAWQLSFTTPDDVQRKPTVIVGRQLDELFAWYIAKEGGKPETFKKVQLKDESLILTIRPKEYPEMTVTLDASLVKEDECAGTGTYVSDDGDSESWRFTGKRLKMSDFDEVTKWNINFETPDGEAHQALVTVVSKKDKLYAWYSSDEYEIPAQEFRQEGDRVVMSLTAKTHEGSMVDVTFRGTVDGDKVQGTADYEAEEESGSFPFAGNRKS